MCRLIETIKILDGKAENIFWHNYRLNASRHVLFGQTIKIDLGTFITVPEEYCIGEVKCRITYNASIEAIEFESYSFRRVKSLKIVVDNEIDYAHKYLDRNRIQNLFSQREDKDDILIVRNGCLTDSSYCNLALWDGKQFHTPGSPLLKGTKRNKYLSEGILEEKKIKADELKNYQEIHLINAFMDLGRNIVLIKDIL